MKQLIFYKPVIFQTNENLKFPGMEKFLHFFKIYAFEPIVDRTNTVKLPINAYSLYPIPKFTIFTKSYEEICNDRAKELLARVDKENKKLYIFYSGGIDSTLIVVSLLKFATPKQKENIVILLTDDSISENPNFYKEYIEGKLGIESALNYPQLLGIDSLFVTGDHNDAIFGSVKSGEIMEMFGNEIINKPYDKKVLVEFFNTKVNNKDWNMFYVELFDKLCKNSPVKIVTFHDFLWWVHFAIRWQSCFTRPLLYCNPKNFKNINLDYFNSNYISFFGNEDFQLWSMNNLDKKIKDTWKSYKWICKEIIYDFNQDSEYRDNKVKVPSSRRIFYGNNSKKIIDSEFNFYDNLDLEECYNPDNDFI